MKACLGTGAILAMILFTLRAPLADTAAEEQILGMLRQPQPYTTVPAGLFGRLGWDLPDGGAAVKALADAAPGSAFDPRNLERLPAAALGYKASWHVVRYRDYNLDWDITGLKLTPEHPVAGMPTLVIVHGGAANWYEFFVDPLNRPGLGQYLAQKIPVLLVTIPGNFRYGGWAGDDLAARVPAYVLDRDIGPAELRIRNAVFTFRVVADGVKKLVETVTTGPVVITGHSTGGEIQYLLQGTALRRRTRGLSLGWGTGGPAGLDAMRKFRGKQTSADYLDVWKIRPRPPSDYARGYLGPLNPVWDPDQSRQAMAGHWMSLERRRRPDFKQPLQDMEHQSAGNLRDYVAGQIRRTLQGNHLGVKADEVVADLFSTMRSPLTGYRRMIWTTASLDSGHWNPDPGKARELRVANEFRARNPGIPIRVLLFDVPMTHYGHIEKPRQLAGGIYTALRWLVQP